MFITKQKYLKIKMLYFNIKDDKCHLVLSTQVFYFWILLSKNITRIIYCRRILDNKAHIPVRPYVTLPIK
jgi:hypothetical protein